MKSVAEFKGRLHVGAKLHAIYHREYIGRDGDKVIYGNKDLGVREVSIVQTNSFALKTFRKDGSSYNSWCSYPKASQCELNSYAVIDPYFSDSITICEEDRDGKMVAILTYKFV